MDKMQAVKYLAERIMARGEIKDGNGCLCPSDALESTSQFHQVSDKLFEEFGATHYSRTWEQFPTSVKIELFAADAFGAAGNEKLVHTEVVELNIDVLQGSR